ncbi:MAG: hypothetical protein ABI855_11030, partial [Bacteroidota bacterium]
ITGSKIYMSYRDERKYLPCDQNTNLGYGANYNSQSTGGYINQTSESEGNIDFQTMTITAITTSTTKSDMGSLSTTNSYRGNSKSYEIPLGDASSKTNQSENELVVEFLPNNKIKLTNKKDGNWSVIRKIKDL